MPWATAHRPRVLEDVVGQDVPVRILRNILTRYHAAGNDPKLLPRSIILEGAFGSGKTTLARILARYLNCKEGPLTSCGVCKSCKDIEHDRSRALVEMDAATNRGIADINAIKDTLNYKVMGNYRVVIMDEAHQITKDGWAALLKVLEEPGGNNIFVFATTDAHKILDTVYSRSVTLRISTVNPEIAAVRIKTVCDLEGVQLEEHVAQTIALCSKGHMRDCMQLAETGSVLAEGRPVAVSDIYEAAGLSDVTKVIDFVNMFYYNQFDALCAFIASYTDDPMRLIRSARFHLHSQIVNPSANDGIILADKILLIEQLSLATQQLNSLNLEFPFIMHFFREFQEKRIQKAAV
jgi:DNA polymerase-3 subunit gamma/tau